jgi:hypothetical protein
MSVAGSIAWKRNCISEICNSNYTNRSPKLKIYKSLIRPIVTYGCEAWTLTNGDEQYLRIFQRRILRKIFGPAQNEEGFWRIRMNHELNDLIKSADIVRYVKSKGMAWLGHVMRMEGETIPKRVLEWKPMGRRNIGRPRKRWIEEIEKDIQIIGIRGWRKLCKERAEWNRITEKAKNPQWVVTPVKEEEEFQLYCY